MSGLYVTDGTTGALAAGGRHLGLQPHQGGNRRSSSAYQPGAGRAYPTCGVHLTSTPDGCRSHGSRTMEKRAFCPGFHRGTLSQHGLPAAGGGSFVINLI